MPSSSGDACHAMLPHHGQGANQSIEGAVVLAASAWDTGTLLHLADDHPRLAERDRRFAGYLPANAWVHDHDAEDLTTTGGTR